ncbi:MAG: ABC transporter ATP-binding protein [Candidatus Hodarchaeaceae archaeon]|nr:ABC transporter ATP-binding protein [Candidatus Hodarchaeaceae archaeon]
MTRPLLKVRGLKTYFFMDEGVVKAVDGVSFDLRKGEILGLVGESGCGKTVTALSILRLIPSPPGKIVTGRIIFRGEDLLKKSEEGMRRLRGSEISMIFQDPHTALDPVFTVGDQIAEPIELHQVIEEHLISPEDVPKKVVEMLKLVGMPDPEVRVVEYPHQFSGGMKQRSMIAMMLSCNPSLLIADEPTTALDVTIQAQILELMRELRRRLNTSILIITHNLGVIAQMCDRVAVMYAGNIVEEADLLALFESPKHPYTQALLKAIPKADVKRGELVTIPGTVPSLVNPPPGCRFHPRCPYAMDICKKENPNTIEVEKEHLVRCHLFGEGVGK